MSEHDARFLDRAAKRYAAVMRLVGKAPSVVTTCSSGSLVQATGEAGFEILENERHGTKKSDYRPFIVARAI